MKKSYIILWALLVLCITACRNKPQATTADGKESCNICFDTLRINRHFPLDTIDGNSPALQIEMELLVPGGNIAKDVAENMNACISYAAFESEGMKAAEAADSFVNSMKNEYLELRNDYINEKAVNPYAPWFNSYYKLNSCASKGYNDCICYVIDYEVYSGGAHPSSIISCVNMDRNTGKEIALQDIFADGTEEELTERLIQRLAKQHGVNSIEELQALDYLILGDMYVTNNFILDKDSIIFLYNNYEIAPYYKGRSRIGFAYDELTDLFKTEQAY